jgi:hypothetical protein
MKFVLQAQRSSRHGKAIDAAEGVDLYSLMELLLETGETERFADLLRRTSDVALERMGHFMAVPAAKRLEELHPDLAARIWCAQGLHIVNTKLSRHYHATLSYFEHAMRCFQEAGLPAEWQKTVGVVRAAHHRKTGFMTGFEALVAGSGP